MPWVYTIDLLREVDAGTIQTDWLSIANEGIANGLGGVTVIGSQGVVVSTPREPNYADMESNFDYVGSVVEHKEIPNRGDEAFDPPIELGNGITLAE